MLTAIMGTAGAVIAAAIGAWAALRARRPRKSKLKLVDVTAVPDGDSVVLDVKLYNQGGQTAVVKRMGLQVLRAARLRQWAEKEAALTQSGTYDVKLPVPEHASAAQPIMDLSHVIEPDDADRFLVRLHADVPEFARFLYLLRLELIYDADDRRVASSSFAIVCPNKIKVWAPADLEFQIGCKDPRVAKIVLDHVENEYPELVNILASAGSMSQGLQAALEQAKEALQQLPVLRERLAVRRAKLSE